jgi:hypothetical protein
MKTLLRTLILATIGAALAAASSLTISFDQPDQTAMPGQLLQFFGTITNASANPIFIDSDDPNLSGASLAFLDMFFANVPGVLAPSGQPGDSTGDINLFDIDVIAPLRDAPGSYLGLYTLVGGSEPGDQDILGMAGFTVTTVTPEPSAIYLLVIGLSAVLARGLWPAARRTPDRVI